MELLNSSKKILDGLYIISENAGLTIHLHRMSVLLQRADFDFRVVCDDVIPRTDIWVFHPAAYKEAVEYLEKKYQRPPVVHNLEQCSFPFRIQSRL